MFSKPDVELTKLTDALRETNRELAMVRGDLEARRDERDLGSEVVDLREKKLQAELDLVKVKEQHEREKRDIDHKIGLHRQRVDQEIELSRKEAVLDVREENLNKDRERFEQEMDYTRKRFSEEVERLTTLQKEILERLPKWSVDRKVTESILAGSTNGKHVDDEDED